MTDKGVIGRRHFGPTRKSTLSLGAASTSTETSGFAPRHVQVYLRPDYCDPIPPSGTRWSLDPISLGRSVLPVHLHQAK